MPEVGDFYIISKEETKKLNVDLLKDVRHQIGDRFEDIVAIVWTGNGSFEGPIREWVKDNLETSVYRPAMRSTGHNWLWRLVFFSEEELMIFRLRWV